MDINTYLSVVSPDLDAFKQKNAGKIYSDIRDTSGNQYVDLVMEGGGVLGIALVGYTYALEQAGIRFWRIGGASAGAINAMLLAAGSPFGEAASLEVLDALSTLDISSFIDGNWFVRALVKHCVLSNGIDRFSYGAIVMGPIIYSVIRKEGLNPGIKFAAWIRDFLSKHRISNNKDLLEAITIGQLLYHGTPIDVYPKPRLSIVASDVTTQTKAQLPLMASMYWADDAAADPSLFVRASMSIPLFFYPFQADQLPKGELAKERWKDYEGEIPTDKCTFVDGGIMSNFPISLFHTGSNKVPRAPTFGARLNKKLRSEQKTDKLFPFLGAMFNTARHTLDYDFLMNHPDFSNLIAYIDTKDQNWLNFYLTDQDKIALFRYGVASALNFLDSFDWEAYKEVRRKLGDDQPW